MDVEDKVSGMSSSWKSSLSNRCSVYRAMVFLLFFFEKCVDNRSDMNIWHIAIQLIRELFIDSLNICIPPSSIQIESININTILWLLIDILFTIIILNDSKIKDQRVNRYFVFPSIVLFGASKEWLSEEESTDPEGRWCSFIYPLLNELQSLY